MPKENLVGELINYNRSRIQKKQYSKINNKRDHSSAEKIKSFQKRKRATQTPSANFAKGSSIKNK